ncbi:methyltransferase domain-containing protein [Nitrospina watsonii]|uniref:Methyltransferase, Cysteine dioxygenase type I family n=1 Tax=Nitrospina watsonii TaxID=1323948 RepID=A0ABN8W1Y4_9BACT|nr:methyltransferase domain-containing protein [Nitrospina watsonii]CAI2717196.1 Putative Methyltransferase, Cysteine dioxygenase type I family [Nitrospina watsonii]
MAATSPPLPDSLQALIEVVEKETHWSPQRAAAILRAADLAQIDLMPWAYFDHPVKDSYGRRLVHDGGHYEMMVMSWNPGDVSALHDHGYAQWGAVQVFGPAEHASFWLINGELHTQSRTRLKPGEVMHVGHEWVHQMGNTSGIQFLTFHLYGCVGRRGGITESARIFDLDAGQVHLTNNGVFFALPDAAITARIAGPMPDFMTRLRHQVELKRRLDRMRAQAPLPPRLETRDQRLIDDLFDAKHWHAFESDLMLHVDPGTGCMTDLGYWQRLRGEVQTAAVLQERLRKETDRADPFDTYAELYDAVVGGPCLETFMESYLEFAFRQYGLDHGGGRFLSLGCGTGIVEDHLVRRGRVSRDCMHGIDKSPAMVKVAERRIHAWEGDLLDLKECEWDVTFNGLNVFQYLLPQEMEQAVRTAARITRPGGHFVGDFITPDHIRVYPHVIRSKCGKVISLRQPELIEDGGHLFQRSAILNVSRLHGTLQLTDEGRHRRTLPPLARVRGWFEDAFGGRVDVFDAVTLDPIAPSADTCWSTRYLIIAHKK